MVTINQALQMGINRIEKITETPLLDAQILLSRTLGMERLRLIIDQREQVSEESLSKYMKLIDERAMGRPVQYIIGSQEFMGLEFYVDERVLIPRGDTEVLVEKIIDDYSGATVRFAEVGTGSGAIAISLVKLLDGAMGTTLDISDDAIEVATINMERIEVSDRLKIVKSDVFSALDVEEGSLDFIVSNPPYIPSKVIDELHIRVKGFEPHLALDGGDDGLDFYRQIVEEAPKYLKDGGAVYFEVGHDQGDDVGKLFEEKGYSCVEKIKDLQGFDRVIKGIFRLNS